MMIYDASKGWSTLVQENNEYDQRVYSVNYSLDGELQRINHYLKAIHNFVIFTTDEIKGKGDYSHSHINEQKIQQLKGLCEGLKKVAYPYLNYANS
jgi:hypothetical protein